MVPRKSMRFLQVILCVLGLAILTTTLVLGGTPLNDEELDTVGAGGLGVSVPAEMPTPLSLTDQELEEALASGGIPQYIWPFQYVPDSFLSNSGQWKPTYLLPKEVDNSSRVPVPGPIQNPPGAPIRPIFR